MTATLRSAVAVSVLALTGFAPAALAAPHVRTGFTVGAGFGIESVSWTDPGGERNVEASGSVNARLGWALKPDLMLGVELWGWSQEDAIAVTESTDDVLVKFRLAAVNACATYYPGNAGFFIRLGAGLAYGSYEVAVPAGVTSIPPDEQSDTGIAVNFAPGYEWRLSKQFALGAQGDVVYLGIGGPYEDVFGYGINAQFNWYW